MDQDTKIMFGKLLGEIYRTQEMMKKGGSNESRDQVYGLLCGIESVIDEQLERVGFVSSEKMNAVEEVLAPIWEDEEKLSKFKGYYDIEHDLERRGVSRGEAIVILKYLKANGRFTDVIDRMDTTNSPTECGTFQIRSFDGLPEEF